MMHESATPFEHEPPIALEYATRDSLPPPPDTLRTIGLWLVGVTGGVGIAIVLLFAVTRVASLTMAGLIWLFIGAFATVAALVLGVIYASIASGRGYPAPSTRRRAAMAVAFPLLNFVLAALCIAAGIALDSYFRPGEFGD